MRGQRARVVGAITLLWIAGCGTAGGSGSGNSGNSSQSNSGSGNSGNSSQSNSGNSGSSKSGSSQSQSGNSGSGNSSQSNSGNSGSSKSGSSQSQSGNSNSSNSSGSSRSSQGSQSPVVSITLGGATVVGLGYAIWALARTPAVAVPPPEAVGEAAQAYLRGRTHQLREDLSLGAGPSIEDLAALAHIRRENLRLFGWVLRAHRVELLALADNATLTPERAMAWLARVGELATTQPPLQEDRLTFIQAHGPRE